MPHWGYKYIPISWTSDVAWVVLASHRGNQVRKTGSSLTGLCPHPKRLNSHHFHFLVLFSVQSIQSFNNVYIFHRIPHSFSCKPIGNTARLCSAPPRNLLQLCQCHCIILHWGVLPPKYANKGSPSKTLKNATCVLDFRFLFSWLRTP